MLKREATEKKIYYVHNGWGVLCLETWERVCWNHLKFPYVSVTDVETTRKSSYLYTFSENEHTEQMIKPVTFHFILFIVQH